VSNEKEISQSFACIYRNVLHVTKVVDCVDWIGLLWMWM
jgi:hypothetical protein